MKAASYFTSKGSRKICFDTGFTTFQSSCVWCQSHQTQTPERYSFALPAVSVYERIFFSSVMHAEAGSVWEGWAVLCGMSWVRNPACYHVSRCKTETSSLSNNHMLRIWICEHSSIGNISCFHSLLQAMETQNCRQAKVYQSTIYLNTSVNNILS